MCRNTTITATVYISLQINKNSQLIRSWMLDTFIIAEIYVMRMRVVGCACICFKTSRLQALKLVLVKFRSCLIPL